ncbi:protein phosphatase 1 regulatory subunit 37 [Eucyclogobius newberryi]|uniref:protein phosphatase 1 regulatory subunit 37 n=1 Tax=Eucyclogobius newberryi TaxID=166745 RepID=UPI003B59F99D
MNIEEQCLDVCNIKTKANDQDNDNTSNHSEGVMPCISELMMDISGDKQTIVPTDTTKLYPMPQLTDNLQATEEDNYKDPDGQEIDEVNGNSKSNTQNTPMVENPSDISNEEPPMDSGGGTVIKEEKENELISGESRDGDMDIGLDLSLNESGVLEAESSDVTPSNIALESELSPLDNPSLSTTESLPDEDQNGGTALPTTEQTKESPAVDEAEDKLKTSGKRVTFPLDEDIVSGAVEPKDPWRHAQNVTVEEILSAYKLACQKLNCKPLPKVLKQIQELNDLTQRNECLDLKGEKLDYKSCEALEEILKRVQFKVIDLEQTNLDEDGASALFDMIEYYESATHLNISFNKHIGTRGWQAAAHMMRKTSSLQYLDARNTPLLDHSAPFVARALRISGSLAVLHLENAGLSGRPLMLLATALKMNMNLRELYLADNKLNGLQDSAQLGNLLKFNYNIQILDLRNNHILDSGLAYICEGLKEQRKGLVTLVLWNNQLTHNGMGYLAAALPCTQSLETLNLGHNSVSNEGIHKLKDGLIANRSVLRLGLASTKLSCEGAVAIAEFIAESPRLLRLDLRENEIKTGGLMALSLALKVNTSLLRLDLDREPKKETVKSFIETQRALLTEIQNGCKRNFILAKEKEENEQKMRLSASMAEIATEDGTGVEEEEGQSSADQGEGPKKEEQEEKPESGAVAGSQSDESTDPPAVVDSDSDTEDEEEVVVVCKTPSAPAINDPPPPAPPAPPPAAPPPAPPPAPPATEGQSSICNITITEAAVPTGTPPSPGRCISVSSPGRGHKIFMVTRVESPPEQQQAQAQATSKRENLSKTSVNTDTTSITENMRTSALNSEQSPEATLNAPQTNTLKELLIQPAEDTTTGTLNTRDLEPSAQGTDSPPEHTLPQSLTKDTAQSTKSPQSDPPCELDSDVGSLLEDKEKHELQQPVTETLPEMEQPDDSQLMTAHESSATVASQNPEMQRVELEAEQSNEEQVPATEMQESNLQPEEADDGSAESSADECFSEALTGEEEDISAVLPNGLKTEFSLHLLDSDSPKPGSCVMEHVSVSCGQDLEELLLEASLDTGKDAP